MAAPYTQLSPIALPGGRYSFIAKDAAATTILTVWSKFGTYRYLRDQAAGSGTTVTWAQARNERRSFQILARADGSVTNLDIATAVLSDGNGNTIAASNLDVYRANQIEVVQNTWTNSGDSAGVGATGWYPDALIPTVHPVTGATIDPGSTYQALPYTLPANQTHTFLIDVFIPTSTIAGTYTGTVTVSADGQSDVEITISLTVFDFSLPDTPAFIYEFGTPANRIYSRRTVLDPTSTTWTTLSNDEWNDVTDVCHAVWQEHYLAATARHLFGETAFRPTGSGTSWSVSAAAVTAAQTRIDTTSPSWFVLTRPHNYIIPYDSDETDAYLDAYAAGITSVNRPNVTWGFYLYDEAFFAAGSTFVNQWGPHIFAQPSMECLVTGTPELLSITYAASHDHASMIGSVDIWGIPFKYYETQQQAAAQARIAEGESLWLYTTLSGDSASLVRPHWALDRDVLNYRVMPWICSHENGTGSLYWASGVYAEDVARAGGDHWTEPVTYMLRAIAGTVGVTNGSATVDGTGTDFDGGLEQTNYLGIVDSSGNRHIHRIDTIVSDTEITLASTYQGATEGGLTAYDYPYNSEGLVAYPCTAADVGFNGVVTTMRLKAIRDGAQDFGYIALAKAWGLSADAITEVNALITAIGDGSWTWDTDPDAYDAARERLGAMLALGNRNPPSVVRRVPGTDTTVRRVAGADTVVRRVAAADTVVRRV